MRLMRHIRPVALALLMAMTVAAARSAEGVHPNDAARFLAGMTPAADSPLMPLTQDPSWQRHARFFDRAFEQLEQRQLSKIRAFSEAHLAAPRPTMFYMFSGPDFLYADAFYPKARTYILGALEPIGAAPDLARLSPGGVAQALYAVERSLGSILTFSFFITREMKVDLHASQIRGTLPILYVFLVRSGKTIRDVSRVVITADGELVPAAAALGRNQTAGVRIDFAGADGVDKTLYYFTTDLSNTGVRNSGFLKFCAGLGPANSLLKSASYLMYARDFTFTRDFLLSNSATIVQDDSGIPLASYDPRRWRFFPFGRYLGPIAEFPGRYQPQYAALFRNAPPLDFGIGYRWRTSESNLLLSVRLP